MPKLDSYAGHGLVEKAVIARAHIPLELVLPDAASGFNPYNPDHWPMPVGIDIRMFNHQQDSRHIITPLRDARFDHLHATEGHRFIYAIRGESRTRLDSRRVG